MSKLWQCLWKWYSSLPDLKPWASLLRCIMILWTNTRLAPVGTTCPNMLWHDQIKKLTLIYKLKALVINLHKWLMSCWSRKIYIKGTFWPFSIWILHGFMPLGYFWILEFTIFTLVSLALFFIGNIFYHYQCY